MSPFWYLVILGVLMSEHFLDSGQREILFIRKIFGPLDGMKCPFLGKKYFFFSFLGRKQPIRRWQFLYSTKIKFKIFKKKFHIKTTATAAKLSFTKRTFASWNFSRWKCPRWINVWVKSFNSIDYKSFVSFYIFLNVR